MRNRPSRRRRGGAGGDPPPRETDRHGTMPSAMVRLAGSRFASREHERLAARVRRAFYNLRTEGTGAAREAAAIGVGVFIGCTPFFGFHLLICWAVGSVFRLNRLQVYLAANISNPLLAPFLIFAD